MVDEIETVELGVMPTDILEDTEGVQTFFVAEMDVDTGGVQPMDVHPDEIQEMKEKYENALLEHTDVTEEELERVK